DFAVAPEPVAAMPVALIQADEAAVDGSDIDALAVHRGASIREVPVVGVAPNLEVYSPNLAPGARIEGGGRSVRRRKIEPPGGEDRRRFERRPRAAGPHRLRGVCRVVNPRDFQAVDV